MSSYSSCAFCVPSKTQVHAYLAARSIAVVNYSWSQAAEWRANGNHEAAVGALELITQKDSGNPRGWFALGQELAGRKAYSRAQHAYMRCIKLETEPLVLARALLGAGIFLLLPSYCTVS